MSTNNLSRKVTTLGAGKLWVLLIVWIFVVMAALGCSVTIGVQPPRPSEEKIELRQAYEQFLEVSAQAFQTGDGSGLEAVATGEALSWMQRQVQLTHSTGRHEWEEYSQVYFRVTSYDSEVAEARFRALRKSYDFSPETGERYFVGSKPELHEITFLRVNGVWKVLDFTVSIVD